MSPAVMDETIIKAINEGLVSVRTGLETKSAELYSAQMKAFVGDQLPAILTDAMKEPMAKAFREHEVECKRLITERTSRNPLGAPGGDGADVRSLGQRLTDTESFKAWIASGGNSRAAVQMTVKSRIRPAIETKTVTVAGSGYPILPVMYGNYPLAVIPPVMRDLLTVVPLTTSNAVEYVRETWTWNADYQINEGDKKAESTVAYTPVTVAVRTIATFVKVSRQMIADVPYFMSTVDTNLLYAVAKKEDTEILFGNNAAGHLWGIMPQATALPADVLVGATYQADTILAAIAYLANLGYTPTAVVLNPVDWANMQIQKTAQGIYILGGPPSAMAAQSLWGLPVVTTQAMTAGSFLVGAFPPNAALFDRESASVEISYENEDDFVRNLATIRCEERIALAVFRPQAFVKGTLTFTAMAAAEPAAEEPKHNARK